MWILECLGSSRHSPCLSNPQLTSLLPTISSQSINTTITTTVSNLKPVMSKKRRLYDDDPSVYDLPDDVDDEAFKDNVCEVPTSSLYSNKKKSKTHQHLPVVYGQKNAARKLPARNLPVGPQKPSNPLYKEEPASVAWSGITAADIAAAEKIDRGITGVAKADDEVAEAGLVRAERAESVRAASPDSPITPAYQLPDPVYCPFCWAKFLPRAKFWEVDTFVE